MKTLRDGALDLGLLAGLGFFFAGREVVRLLAPLPLALTCKGVSGTGSSSVGVSPGATVSGGASWMIVSSGSADADDPSDFEPSCSSGVAYVELAGGERGAANASAPKCGSRIDIEGEGMWTDGRDCIKSHSE